jgi:hypothetical protein
MGRRKFLEKLNSSRRIEAIQVPDNSHSPDSVAGLKQFQQSFFLSFSGKVAGLAIIN